MTKLRTAGNIALISDDRIYQTKLLRRGRSAGENRSQCLGGLHSVSLYNSVFLYEVPKNPICDTRCESFALTNNLLSTLRTSIGVDSLFTDGDD